MTLVNSYATLQEFLNQRESTDTNTADDAVIELLLSATSRFIDSYTGRTFYPRVETRYFNVPEVDPLYLDDDLCAVTTLTNGDATVISSSDYTLLSANYTPKWAVKIKDSSSISWQTDSNNSAEQVIQLLGTWAYHNDYNRQAWTLATTLAAALNSSAVTFTASDGHTLLANQICKIDNEVFNITSVSSSDTITVNKRGDNGSTAAAHTSDTAVYVWNTQQDIKQACLEITASAYRRRKGQYVSGAAQVTAAGVVITPQDIPGQAREILNKYVRVT